MKVEDYRINFVDNLRYLLKIRRMPWKHFAKLAGLGVNDMNNWRHGMNPSFKALIVISDYFEISIDELIGRGLE